MNGVLNLTTQCNLNCDYCYYRDNSRDQIMSEKIISQAMDLLYQLSLDKKDDYLNITFFGGEPLLVPQLMYYAVDYSERNCVEPIQITYAINTNATLLTGSLLDFLEEKKFVVYVSLDGNKETHDRHRHFGTPEKGSFDKIFPHLSRLASLNTSIETVITPETVDDTFTSVEYFLAGLGFRRLILMPDFMGNWNRDSFDRLMEQYALIADFYYSRQKKNENFYINLIEDKIKLYLAKTSLKKTICNIGLNILAVSPAGDLFPCVRFVTTDANSIYRIGHVDTGLDGKKMLEIHNYHQKDKTECDDCTVKDRCLGNGCGCTNYYTTGTLEGISPLVCEHERGLIRLADRIGEKLLG